MRVVISRALQSLHDHFGNAVFTRSNQFKGALDDVLGEMRSQKLIDSNESARARNLIVTAVYDLDAYTRLEASLAARNTFAVSNLAQEMIAKYDTKEESAKTVIECIAELVGYGAMVTSKLGLVPAPVSESILSKPASESTPKLQIFTSAEKECSIQELQEIRESLVTYNGCIAAGAYHTAGLKTDGTVVAVGNNEYDQCNVADWRDIVAVAAGEEHTVGLKADGSVVAVGISGACKVSHWQDIIAIAAGTYHTIGLKSDGTVVATGGNSTGECNVTHWRDIISVAADSLTVGVKSDGAVVAAGMSFFSEGLSAILGDVIAVSIANCDIVGLKANGTVSAVWNTILDGWYSVGDWRNIVTISSGSGCVIGLKADGTLTFKVSGGVFSKDENGESHPRHWHNDGGASPRDWQNIVAVSAGRSHMVGLQVDGTVVMAGMNAHGKCDITEWSDIGPSQSRKKEVTR